MEGALDLTSYRERLLVFQNSDIERQTMVAELVTRYDELKVRYERQAADLANETESRHLWQQRAGSANRELLAVRREIASGAFAFVVIDGDGAIFQEALLAQGADGGAAAAHQLKKEIKKHLSDIYPDGHTEEWNVIVQVVLNVEGLARAIHASGVAGKGFSLQTFLAFVRDFGRTEPLFGFTDVGYGKEQADHKIRELLRAYVRPARHIFFGPCADNGYAPFLQHYKLDETVATKITLIEATPAEPSFVSLGFRRLRMPEIFRTENLPKEVARPTPIIAPAGSPLSIRPAVASSDRSSTSPVSQTAAPLQGKPTGTAANGANGAAAGTWSKTAGTKSPGTTFDIGPTRPPKRKFYIVNKWDERLDVPLPRPDVTAEKRFTERMTRYGKCCNRFHLSNNCPAGDYCEFSHGERLSASELLVLKHKARSIHCTYKELCDDPDCHNGHVCKYGSSCTTANCRFAETHQGDHRPAFKVYEDGTREPITAYSS